MDIIRSIDVYKKVKPLGFFSLWRGRGPVLKDFMGKIGFELYFKGRKYFKVR